MRVQSRGGIAAQDWEDEPFVPEKITHILSNKQRTTQSKEKNSSVSLYILYHGKQKEVVMVSKEKAGLKKRLAAAAALVLAVVAIVAFALYDFNTRIYYRQYNSQKENVAELAKQGRLMVEQRLQGYLDTLNALAEMLPEGELVTEENLKHLRNVVGPMDFDRLALSGPDGRMYTTASINADVADRPYFQQAMQGQGTISGVEHSRISANRVFVVAVPVWDDSGHVRGMLQGALSLDNWFDPYAGTRLENSSHVRVVDQDGNYLIGARGVSEDGFLAGDNLMTDLAAMNLSRTLEDISAELALDGGVQFHAGEHEIYMERTDVNGWMVVTAVCQSEVQTSVQTLLGSDLKLLMLKCGAAVVVLFLGLIGWILSAQTSLMRSEKELRSRLMADTLGFLVVDLQANRMVRGTESIIAPCTFDMAFDRVMADIVHKVVTPQYRQQLLDCFNSKHLMQHFRDGQREFVLEYQVKGRDGKLDWRQCSLHMDEDENGRQMAYLTFRNITETKRSELELRDRAEKDFLTGLDNRSYGREKIIVRLQKLEPGQQLAFMVLDLDNFKNLNDTLGHQSGDRALREVAQILRHHFREEDVVARLGGDEFMVLFRAPDSRERLENRLQQLMDKLHLQYEGSDKTVCITGSAGVAVAPDAGTALDVLYKKADAALYQVKQSKKGGFRICEN